MKRNDINADAEFVTNEQKGLNIYQRMLMIEKELGVVAKNLQIQATRTSGYKAVSERDVIDAVKPLEARYGVFSFPADRQILTAETLESERLLANGDKATVTSKFIRAEVTYRFVNVDNPEEYVEVKGYGDGIDTGDKAPGKAMTYADKYALMKAYKISTGDDPDQEKSPDDGYRVKQTEEPKATANQIKWCKSLEYADKVFAEFGVTKWEDLTMKQASAIIERNRGKK